MDRLERIKKEFSPFMLLDMKWLIEQLEQWKLVAGDRYNDWEKVEKENAQLREALGTIASEDGVSEGYQYADEVANNLISIAKSALEEIR